MDEMRLRPALRPYAWVCAGVIVFFFVIALIFGLLSGQLLIFLGIAVILSVLVLIKFAHIIYVHYSNEYVVNDSEIIRVAGIWAKNEYHVPIDKIEDYKVTRTFFGRMLGVANVGIQTARAERGFEITLQSMLEKDAADLDQLLEKLTDQADPKGV